MKWPMVQRLIAGAFFCALLATICIAQEDTKVAQPVKLILTDGSELVGTILDEDSLSIVFETIGGISLTVPRSQVNSTVRLSGYLIDGTYLRNDPNHTRLFFAPTARRLKSNQGYFSAYQIFFPMVAVGIADIVTLAGGISLFPFVSNQLMYLAPKITPVELDNLSIAGGFLYLNPTSGGADGVGIAYIVGSYGAQISSLTAGIGWGFSGNETADTPIIMIGGELRASNGVKLITENWIPLDSEHAFYSLGIRFLGERVAADFALVYPSGSSIRGFPFIPWVGFAYNFGPSK